MVTGRPRVLVQFRPSDRVDSGSGVATLKVVLEHPRSGLDPPIGLDQKRGAILKVVSEPRFRRFWKKALNDFEKGF